MVYTERREVPAQEHRVAPLDIGASCNDAGLDTDPDRA
jgi:hypothetical protein